MFNPILEIISSVYQWLWIAIVIVLAVDWSLGFDKVSAALERACNFYEKLFPIEAIFPAALLTVFGCLCRLLSITDSAGFFVVLANLFGILVIGYVAFISVFGLFYCGLTKLRETSIARRTKKARKKSLTDTE